MLAARRRIRVAAALAVCCSALAARPSSAAEPFVNLGFTSFVDGFPDPTGEGFTFVEYLRFATATHLKDADGNDAAGFVEPRLHALVSVTQLLYTFKKLEGLGVTPGIGVLIPIVLLDADFGAGGASLEESRFGVGDVFVGPSIQFPTVMRGEQPVFLHRFEFDVMVPIGKYDRDRQINQGNNAWGLNPFWAATLFPGAGLELSARLHYLYNFENSAPPLGPPGAPALTSTRAGQAFHANLAASYEVLPRRLRLGVSSYYFRQLTDSQANGVGVPRTREQVLGIGPGLVFFPSKVDLVFLNAYFETAVRNRFQSHSLQIRWGRAFEGF